jgi:hypothetical protein
MNTLPLPTYLKFDHVLNITPRQFTEMEGKPESNFYYVGSKTIIAGEWILFQTISTTSTNHQSRKLIRVVQACQPPIPLYLDDDAQCISVAAHPGQEYEVLMCEFNTFINNGNVIKIVETPVHADVTSLPETRKKNHKQQRS